MEQTTSGEPRGGWWRSAGEPVFTFKTVVILVAVALTWAFALASSKRLQPPDPSGSGRPWSLSCPHCGVVESVTLLPDPVDPGDLAAQPYRLGIRMADGSLRLLERPSLLAPGSRVTVEGHTVALIPDTATARPERQ